MISTALSAVSLRDLALVQAVAREGSFISAARLMNISASGLSHQVQKVEQALGITLFERGGRGVALAGGGARVIALIERLAGQLPSGCRPGHWPGASLLAASCGWACRPPWALTCCPS